VRLENKTDPTEKKYYRKKYSKEPSFDMEDVVAPKEKPALNTKLTQLDTLDLLLKGYDIKKIAEIRNLDEKIIKDHTAFLTSKKLWKKK